MFKCVKKYCHYMFEYKECDKLTNVFKYLLNYIN